MPAVMKGNPARRQVTIAQAASSMAITSQKTCQPIKLSRLSAGPWVSGLGLLA